MQTDAEVIDAWWRANDPTRTLRSDLAQFPCGQQVDISIIRLTRSSTQLASVNTRFGQIANALIALQFSSAPYTKYVVYYDGPVEPGDLRPGRERPLGARLRDRVPPGLRGGPAQHDRRARGDPHPRSGGPGSAEHVRGAGRRARLRRRLRHDVPVRRRDADHGAHAGHGTDDYYGHSGSWPDAQDSPWLVRLDRQVPLTVAIAGPGSVTADVPGLHCGADVHDDVERRDRARARRAARLGREARALGRRLQRERHVPRGRGSGADGVRPLRPEHVPADGRRRRSGRGAELAGGSRARHGARGPFPRTRRSASPPAPRRAGASRVGRRMPRDEAGVHAADDLGGERARCSSVAPPPAPRPTGPRPERATGSGGGPGEWSFRSRPWVGRPARAGRPGRRGGRGGRDRGGPMTPEHERLRPPVGGRKAP